jgi:hypothetical protein
LTCPELYQSAYGIVLALRFAIAQTGHESRFSFNSDVTRHRAQNFRIFSNLSQVTEGTSECPKEVTKIGAE